MTVKSICDKCSVKDCVWRAPSGGLDPPVMDCKSFTETVYVHEWVVCGDGENVPYLCSHCGKTVPAILIEKYPHNFCPNCGAKMT